MQELIARILESILERRIVRGAAGMVFLGRGHLALLAGRFYRGISDLCWVARVSGIGMLERPARRVVFQSIDSIARTGHNHLVDAYRLDKASTVAASGFSLSGIGPRDLFRDLIVLKRWTPREKGVILLKYAKTFDAVVSLLDLTVLMRRYTFVLEPCWAGYCDPSLLMFVQPGHPVLVQCFTQEDFEFVSTVGVPLVPVRLGPADWVDADLFAPAGGPKTHDLVMVASWAPRKRHALLFRALRDIRDRDIRVLLIGFPWGGRTADDIRRRVRGIGNGRVTVDVLESLPAQEVAAHVSRCRVFVFLSRKEGDNKALVEAMFANVPAIVYDRTVGGARSRINSATGVLASDARLADTIRYMLDHHEAFAPRAWALEHAGSANATRVLNDALRQVVISAGGTYTENVVEKTNSPNLQYKDPQNRVRFSGDYDFILSCRRELSGAGREAVA